MINVFKFMDLEETSRQRRKKMGTDGVLHFGSLVLRVVAVPVAKAHGSLLLTFSQDKRESGSS